jgi:hypothetical protein
MAVGIAIGGITTGEVQREGEPSLFRLRLTSDGPSEACCAGAVGSDLQGPIMSDLIEEVVAPAAIERAFGIYQQLQQRDQSVLLQARKILTQHIYGMVDRGERNERRLAVGGLAHLKAVERDHAIKSAQDAPTKKQSRKACA